MAHSMRINGIYNYLQQIPTGMYKAKVIAQAPHLNVKKPIVKWPTVANGQIQWTPLLDWQLNLQATAPDLTTVLPQAPKNLNVTIKSGGNAQAFNLNLTQLQSTWQNQPLRGAMNFQMTRHNPQPENNLLQLLTNSRFTLDANVQWGATQLNVNGGLTDNWQLRLNLIAADLR